VAPALEFSAITKRYSSRFRRRQTVALQDFSLAVQPGEIFGFLGPNGAGKTTALHIAMGFVRPTQGGGSMLGRSFGDAATRRRVGFLAENVALYNRTARDVVRFYGALNGMRDPELRRRTQLVLEQMEMSAEAERKVGKFSRGMLQRIGLAQALVNDPELLIFDEPTSALDPLARAHVRELLLQAKAAGKTVFLSSHLLSEVEAICDRVAFLIQGRVVLTGKPSELLESRDQVEIVARGVAPETLQHFRISSQETADGILRFTAEKSQQRPVIEAVWQSGGELVSVMPARISLEQMFLRLAESPTAEPSGKAEA
jgi:ABC-2 type transport system ATP-binding protein